MKNDFLIGCGDGTQQPCVLVCRHVFDNSQFIDYLEIPPQEGSDLGIALCAECGENEELPKPEDGGQLLCWPCFKNRHPNLGNVC